LLITIQQFCICRKLGNLFRDNHHLLDLLGLNLLKLDNMFDFLTFSLTIHPFKLISNKKVPTLAETLDFTGADGRNRTGDLQFTKLLLYRLSYIGTRILSVFYTLNLSLQTRRAAKSSDPAARPHTDSSAS
jgi:hypothetical protein